MRSNAPLKVLPVYLVDQPAVPPEPLVFSPETALTKKVCELVKRYEEELARSKPRRTQLVKRNVVESARWSAKHLPLCPEPEDHSLLAEEDIDCVACAFDFDASFFSFVSIILRVEATRGRITPVLYVTSAPKLIGMIPMRLKGIFHFINGLGSGDSPTRYRSDNPDSPAGVESDRAKETAGRVIHYARMALVEAIAPFKDESSRQRVLGAMPDKKMAAPGGHASQPGPIVEDALDKEERIQPKTPLRRRGATPEHPDSERREQAPEGGREQ